MIKNYLFIFFSNKLINLLNLKITYLKIIIIFIN